MARKIWASFIACYIAIFCSLTSADGQLDAQVSVCEGCHGTNTDTHLCIQLTISAGECV